MLIPLIAIYLSIGVCVLSYEVIASEESREEVFGEHGALLAALFVLLWPLFLYDEIMGNLRK